jgi:N-acetylmuramic acid 6-phosphate (MurNAc-6-P) etherase
MDSIKFEAEVRQVKSMADRSYNLILNIPEYELEQARELMGMLLDHVAVAIVVVSDSNNQDKPTKRVSKRGSI